MTKDYALYGLLWHGPMTRVEIAECTRWSWSQVRNAIDALADAGLLRRYRRVDRRHGQGGYLYGLVSDGR